jgi:hypothetical protein
MSDVRDPKRNKIFAETVYDIETVFESLSIASKNDKELLFMDMLISSLRTNPSSDLTETCYSILKNLKLI